MLAEETDEKMVEFAMGGVCNCCLDKQNKAYLLENECIDFTVKCLSRYISIYQKKIFLQCCIIYTFSCHNNYNIFLFTAVPMRRLRCLLLLLSCT